MKPQRTPSDMYFESEQLVGMTESLIQDISTCCCP